MVRVTCMRCHRGYLLTNEQIVRAMEESRGTKHKHFVVDCPYCRTPAKVPLRSIRQAYTRLERLGLLTGMSTAEGQVAIPEETSASDVATENEVEKPAS